MIHESLHDWFKSELGAYLLERERAWLDRVTPDIFGFHAIQLGLPQVDLLRESRIVHRVTVSPEPAGPHNHVPGQFHELPFETQSIDLCVMPHVLEFSENPHEVLREIDRVLRPEGRVLVLGFNPWSLFGARKLWTSTGYPWQGQFVSLVRIKDWLQLLAWNPRPGNWLVTFRPVRRRSGNADFVFWSLLVIAGGGWGVAFTCLKQSSGYKGCG